MLRSRIQFGFTAKKIIDEGKVTQTDIDLIKRWLENEKVPKLIEEQIVLFLLSCNNEQEATKATIKSFYQMRRNSPDLFDNRSLEKEDLQKLLRTIHICILPERTDDDCVIIFYKFCDTYYYNFNMGPFLTILFMTLDAALYDHPPKGLIFLVDMKGMGIMHLTRVRLGFLKTYFQYLQEGLPIKLKSMHFLNTVYFIEKVVKLITPFAKAEVLSSMHFHASNMDMKGFYERFIPKKCLPEEYGGGLPAIEELHQINVEKLIQLQPYFEAEELQRHSIGL